MEMPPTVRVAVLAATLVALLVAVAVTDPLPVPPVGLKVIHGEFDVAVQAQVPLLAVIVRGVLPPDAMKLSEVGATVKVQALTASCVTVTV